MEFFESEYQSPCVVCEGIDALPWWGEDEAERYEIRLVAALECRNWSSR